MKRAEEVFARFPHDWLFLKDALARSAGNLFASPLEIPETHLLRNEVRQISFIAGRCDSGFAADAASLLQTGKWGPCVSLPSDDWRESLAKLGDLFYIGDSMITFTGLAPAAGGSLEGREAVRLEGKHAGQITLRGWPSASTFVQSSIGFGIVADGQVLSYAISNFPMSDAMEVAVWTSPEHRRRGLAFKSASALLNFCRNKDIEAHWTSWSGNVAACSLARKLGFAEEHPHDWAFVNPKSVKGSATRP